MNAVLREASTFRSWFATTEFGKMTAVCLSSKNDCCAACSTQRVAWVNPVSQSVYKHSFLLILTFSGKLAAL
jgi:hypothetical protein